MKNNKDNPPSMAVFFSGLLIFAILGLAIYASTTYESNAIPIKAEWERHEIKDIATDEIENVELRTLLNANEKRYKWLKSQMFYNCDRDQFGMSFPYLVESNIDHYRKFANVKLNDGDVKKLGFTLHRLGERGYEIYLIDESKTIDQMRDLLFNNELDSVKIDVIIGGREYGFKYDTTNFNIELCD